MYYTALVGFNRFQLDDIQLNHLTTDNCILYEECKWGPKIGWLEKTSKIVIKENFAKNLTRVICEIQNQHKHLLKDITFIDWSNKDFSSRYDLYAIRQGFVRLDEEILHNFNISGTGHLLYLITGG